MAIQVSFVMSHVFISDLSSLSIWSYSFSTQTSSIVFLLWKISTESMPSKQSQAGCSSRVNNRSLNLTIAMI